MSATKDTDEAGPGCVFYILLTIIVIVVWRFSDQIKDLQRRVDALEKSATEKPK